jgi:cellulose synthase (UDP-forming)
MNDVARLAPVFSRKERAVYLVGFGIWAAATLWFFSWWLRPEHVAWAPGYTALTFVLAWIMLVPCYFLMIFFNAERMQGEAKLSQGERIAMVVTKAPSEPGEVVRMTLRAMLAQDVPHDTWLADEDPSPEMIDWCRRHRVYISTRKGVESYHRQTWPRRTRCKEGNLAYFYDHYGYDQYDYVVQLDADHVPKPDYLREMLKPFADPEVGYVSAPSICDANASKSWAARGRLHHEASWHGAQQVGYNNGWAPICIGSHYAVRTAALRQIGGLGPDLAEDHSTTLFFNSCGWRGVHAIDAICHGDGPRTFADLATQEFQWARSLVTILLQYTPSRLSGLSPRLKFQFLFCQVWYPLNSAAMLLLYLMPIIALTFGVTFAFVSFPEFLLRYAPAGLVLTALLYMWRRKGVFRPADAPIISWEGAAYLVAKWPWALMGCLAAVRDHITASFVDFRVTPKGKGPAEPLPWRVLMPYILLAGGSLLPVLLVADAGPASGFYIFAIVNALTYGGISGLILWRHSKENGLSLGFSGRGGVLAQHAAVVTMILLLAVTGSVVRGAEGWSAIVWGAGDVFSGMSEDAYEQRYASNRPDA